MTPRWWRTGGSQEEERVRIRIATRAASTRAEAMHWVSEMRSHLDKLERALEDLPDNGDEPHDEDENG